MRGALKVLKRNQQQRGFVNYGLLRGVAAIGIGLLISTVAVSVADTFGVWSDNEPDWTVIESGVTYCPENMVRVAVKQIAVVRFAQVHITGILWGFGGSIDPTYWYEKSLSITYDCCCRKPAAYEWQHQRFAKVIPVSYQVLSGAVGTAEGTATYVRHTVSVP